MTRPDLIFMTRAHRAKSTGQSRAEYANPFARYRRPVPWRKWFKRAGIVALIIVTALFLGAK